MKLVLISLLILLPSCAWIAAHPVLVEEAIEISEEAMADLYKYETRTLSPAPPQPNEIKPMRQVYQP